MDHNQEASTIPRTRAASSGESQFKSLSLGKALELLRCFTKEQPEWSLADLSRAQDLPKASVLRLARTLEEYGFLARDSSGRYRLGFELVRLSQILLDSLNVKGLAARPMRRLVERFRETTYLSLRQGWNVICIERLDSPEPLHVVADLGTGAPLGVGSWGKSILAFMADEDIEAVIAAAQKGLLPAGLADGEALRAALAEVRSRGYANTTGERLAGITGVTSPIFNARGEPIGAIGLSFPNQRFDRARIGDYASTLCAECREVSRAMGFTNWPVDGPPQTRSPAPVLTARST